MKRSIRSLLQGGAYAFDGIRIFYRDRELWKYAFFSFLFLTFFYLLVVLGAVFLTRFICADLRGVFKQMPSWLSWVSSMANGIFIVLLIVAVALLVALTVTSLYEIFGSFFFDSMTEMYEKKYFSFVQHKFSISEVFQSSFEAFSYCLGTVIIFIFLFFLSLFFPVIGLMITIIWCGYRTGISYLQTPAFNFGYSLKRLREHSKNKFTIVLGFGITSYLLLLVPFATIFVLPGLILGGSTVFHKEIKETI